MDGTGRCSFGEILRIAESLDSDPDFKAAVERDLIGLGLRLRWLCDGTDRLNWRDLLVVIETADEDSVQGRLALGASAHWGITEHLLANVFDALNIANWQRGGGGMSKKPKPMPRPGDQGSQGEAESDTSRNESPMSIEGFEQETMSLEEVAELAGIQL